MWISLLVLSLLIQVNVISSDQVIENPREVRQPIPECCPCPDPKQDVDPDQDTANSHAISDDSCPCRLASDSEPASSFISPAFRKMEQYDRPLSSKKEDPKPLLKPEVGLASSVLETLKEVTDQEYQEAVARDAARSALKFIESEPLENESRNSMNIILSPNAEHDEDNISDASYFKETSYERPLLSKSFERLGSQSPLKMLGKILSTPKLTRKTILHKNNFDMDEGASNIQSNILKPVKNSILDQIKLKADVLKLKLFPNIEKGMKNQAFKDFSQVNTSTNSLLKQMKHIVKNAEYTEPSILNSEKNNLSNQILSPSWHALFNITDPIKLQTINKNPKVNLKNIKDTRNIQPNLKTNLLSDNTVRTLKFSDEDLVENIVCIKNTENPAIFQTYNNDMRNFDDLTKISEVNIDTAVDNIDNVEQKELSETFNDQIQNTNTDNNNLNSNNKKIMISYVEVTTARVIVEKENRDSHNLKCLDSINDLEFDSSNIHNQNVNLRNTPNKKITSSAENTNEMKNALVSNSEYQINNELLSSSYEDRNSTDLEMIKLPNIKSDILRTLENFKKANDKIQEKLKSNMQEALRAVVEKTESVAGKGLSFANQKNSDYKPYLKNENNVNIQDLQKLSDSLLKQSLLKENGHNSKISKSSNYTEKPFDGINMISLLSFSNNTNNSENSKINSSNQQPNPNLIDMAKKEGNYYAICNNEIMPNISDTSNMDNEINELTAQSSNSVLNTMAQLRLSPSALESLSKVRIVQPDETNKDDPLRMDDIKDFSVNYKASSTNNFKDDRNGDLRHLLNADKNSQNFNKGDSSILSPTSTLNSYKTKVATPKSLNLKSLHSSLENIHDVLASPSQNSPANILRYPSEDNFITKILRNNVQNELNPYFKIPHGKYLTDNFSSIIPNISENIKSRTNNAIKSFRESLDASVNKPNIINKSNIFSKFPLNSENLLDTVFKTRKNINDKLQVFKPKIPFDNVGLNPNRLSIFENSAELYKPLEIKSANLRNPLQNLRRIESFIKKPVLFSLTPDKSTDIMPGISKPSLRSNIKKKLESLTNEFSSNSNIGSIGINRPKSYQTKTSIANRSKLKPLKENKIIIRPDYLKSNKNPTLQMNQLKSRTPNLPKLTRKSSIKSNLELNEPKVLASNDFKSNAPYSNSNLKELKIGNHPYAIEEVALPQSIKNNKNILKAKQRTLVLPKFKNAFPALNSNQDANQLTRTEQNVDGALSASNNIDLSATVAEPLKENTSYKCKMICIKDILDVK